MNKKENIVIFVNIIIAGVFGFFFFFFVYGFIAVIYNRPPHYVIHTLHGMTILLLMGITYLSYKGKKIRKWALYIRRSGFWGFTIGIGFGLPLGGLYNVNFFTGSMILSQLIFSYVFYPRSKINSSTHDT
jgi:hypothetical protein